MISLHFELTRDGRCDPERVRQRGLAMLLLPPSLHTEGSPGGPGTLLSSSSPPQPATLSWRASPFLGCFLSRRELGQSERLGARRRPW